MLLWVKVPERELRGRSLILSRVFVLPLNSLTLLMPQYGNFSTSKLCEHTTIDGMLRYHAWEQEKNAELLRRSTARLGYLVETCESGKRKEHLLASACVWALIDNRS